MQTRLDAVVRVRGLVMTYGEQRAVDGIDLDIQPGEIFACSGPTGPARQRPSRSSRATATTAGDVLVLATTRPSPTGLAARVGIVLQSTAEAGELTVGSWCIIRRFYPRPAIPKR